MIPQLNKAASAGPYETLMRQEAEQFRTQYKLATKAVKSSVRQTEKLLDDISTKMRGLTDKLHDINSQQEPDDNAIRQCEHALTLLSHESRMHLFNLQNAFNTLQTAKAHKKEMPQKFEHLISQARIRDQTNS